MCLIVLWLQRCLRVYSLLRRDSSGLELWWVDLCCLLFSGVCCWCWCLFVMCNFGATQLSFVGCVALAGLVVCLLFVDCVLLLSVFIMGFG